MAVVYSKSHTERINGLFASFMEKLDGVSGELRHALEKDIEELRGSVNELLYTKSEAENAAHVKDLHVDAFEALRQSEKFNRQLIESSSDSIKVLDLEGRLLSINSGGLRLLEAENENVVIGRSWVTFWRQEDRPRVQAAVDAACSGQVSSFQAPRNSFQGKELWWDVVISPIRGVDDKVERLLVVSRDITQRKEAEVALAKAHNDLISERNRLMAVMEALPVGLAIYDEKGGISLANPGYEAIWGSPRPPVNSLEDYEMYKAWWVQTGKRVQPGEWASAQSVITGQTQIGQYLRIQRFDGRTGYV